MNEPDALGAQRAEPKTGGEGISFNFSILYGPIGWFKFRPGLPFLRSQGLSMGSLSGLRKTQSSLLRTVTISLKKMTTFGPP